jgi:hypothetical protein
VYVTTKSALTSFFIPLRISVSPMGDRQSVGGAMSLTSLKAASTFLAISRSSSLGLRFSGTPAFWHTCLALSRLTREKSLTRKDVIL